jgi:hypothetical protein
VLPSGVVFLDAVAPSCTALIDGNRQDLEADSPDFWRGWSLRHASRPDVEVDGDLLQIPRIAVAFFRLNRTSLPFSASIVMSLLTFSSRRTPSAGRG